MELNSVLEVPSNFSFPFQPYEIQIEFMKELFKAIDQEKFGIFESPTGTGKSLSLLCGSLTWLETKEKNHIENLKSIVASFNLQVEEKKVTDATDWITAQSNLRKIKDTVSKATRELKFYDSILEKRKMILQKRKQLRKIQKFNAKTKAIQSASASSNDKKNSKDNGKQINFSNENEVHEELNDLFLNDEFAPEIGHSDSEYSDDDEEGEKESEFYPFRVIFASRTHSQLSQFANELKRTDFASRITTVSLGSRQTLCINSEVTKLKNLSLINERCLDLQKSSTKGKSTKEDQDNRKTKKQKTCNGCEYFNHSGIEDLKLHILSEPMDIEDLVTKAKTQFKACPYYASRKASKEAQLVLLPYNSILHSGTRDGIGLKTQNSVILLDEAHNIVDSLSNMYSTSVNLNQLIETLAGLKVYKTRYISRFNAKNLLHLKQIEFILKKLVSYLQESSTNSPVSRVFHSQEFKNEIGIEQLNIHDLLNYIKRAKLLFKLKGYLQLHEKQNELETQNSSKQKDSSSDENLGADKKRKSSQSVVSFIEFLKSVTLSGVDGRIIRDENQLKFLLLNPSEHFSSVTKTARSIILAGGTMKPYDEIEDQLFSSDLNRIHHFSCSHVIPDENLVCLAVSQGPSSSQFEFTYKNRTSDQLIRELSQSILNISRVVPGGLVIFLPSYDYESMFYNHLKETKVLEKIEFKKKVFREPKESNCDKVLMEYSRQIRNNIGGAMLFAVVGGKLSEGINFGDDLGRCVIVVGLPYPNITGVEIKEKLNFISTKFGPEKAKHYLPNICFKAINQSIGRSIRHINDYAAIILLDHRYTKQDSQAQLPDWIRKRFSICNNFGQCIGNLGKFFSSKK